jgi:hypothetical protein
MTTERDIFCKLITFIENIHKLKERPRTTKRDIFCKFITFIENIHKLKERPRTTKRDIFCSKLQLFRIPKLKETYLVYVFFKCNYNYVTTHNYGTKNHQLKQKIKLQKAYVIQVEYFMQGSFANNKLQLKHDNQSHCIKYKINCYKLIPNSNVRCPKIGK